MTLIDLVIPRPSRTRRWMCLKATLLAGIRQSGAKDELTLSCGQERGSWHDSGAQCLSGCLLIECGCDSCGYIIRFKIQIFATGAYRQGRQIQLLRSLWHSYEPHLCASVGDLGDYERRKVIELRNAMKFVKKDQWFQKVNDFSHFRGVILILGYKFSYVGL